MPTIALPGISIAREVVTNEGIPLGWRVGAHQMCNKTLVRFRSKTCGGKQVRWLPLTLLRWMSAFPWRAWRHGKASHIWEDDASGAPGRIRNPFSGWGSGRLHPSSPEFWAIVPVLIQHLQNARRRNLENQEQEPAVAQALRPFRKTCSTKNTESTCLELICLDVLPRSSPSLLSPPSSCRFFVCLRYVFLQRSCQALQRP